MREEKIQKAGDNSQQLQIEKMTINYGISEKRAREIYSEMSEKAIAENTAYANEELKIRLEKLENIVIPRIEKVDKDFNVFADPAFQILLKKAQLTAACTDRDLDYNILSELLVHRIKNRTNIKKKASIAKAIEIIDQIDNDSLCALTLYHAVLSYIPNNGSIKNGIKILSELYEKFDLNDLPRNNEWIDNLTILGVVYSVPYSSLAKLQDIYKKFFNGYVCVGMLKNSEEHKKALEKLNENNINTNIIVDHELLDGYVRLNIVQRESIQDLIGSTKLFNNGTLTLVKSKISQTQKDCLLSIFDSYSKDKEMLEIVKKKFEDLLFSFPPMKITAEWWNSLETNIYITSVGRVLAHTNAKRIDSNIPDLD